MESVRNKESGRLVMEQGVLKRRLTEPLEETTYKVLDPIMNSFEMMQLLGNSIRECKLLAPEKPVVWTHNGHLGFFCKGIDVWVYLLLPYSPDMESAMVASYIHAYALWNDRPVIFALPSDRYESYAIRGELNHTNLVKIFERIEQERLAEIKGGFIRVRSKENRLVLSCCSRFYGKADHKKVASILNKLLNEFGFTVTVRESIGCESGHPEEYFF